MINKKKLNYELNRFIVNPESSIKSALKKITNCGKRCVAVVNKNNVLLGTLADSDIRKALLGNKDINKNIKSIFNKRSYYVLKNNFTYNELQNKILDEGLGIVPIVNDKKKLIDIFYLDKFKKFNKKFKNPIVIMAGGKGTRLAPFTNILPKMLIPVNEKPVIEHILDSFKLYGFHNFNICINHKSVIVKSYFKEKNKHKVLFSNENKPLGTVGGVSKINFIKNKDIIITNCDGIFDINYESLLDYHIKSKADITLVASRKLIKIPYGVCQLDKSQKILKNLSEKPSIDFLANTGLYVVKPKILKLIPKNKYFDFTDLLSKAKKNKKKIVIFPIANDKWNDVGQWEALKITDEAFKKE